MEPSGLDCGESCGPKPDRGRETRKKGDERDTHFDNETTDGLGVHVVAHVLQRTPRHLRTPTSSNASKIRPGPGIPPGYIVPIAAALTATTYTERRSMPSAVIRPPSGDSPREVQSSLAE